MSMDPFQQREAMGLTEPIHLQRRLDVPFMGKQERREDPVTEHRMRLDGYAEARALIHEAKEALGHAETRDVALLMLDRAQDLLRPEPTETPG